MRGHADKSSFVRRGFVDNDLSGDALFHGALYVGNGKCAGNFFQVLFAPPCDILKNGVEKLGVVRGNMRAYRKNVDDLQELHGQLQLTRKKPGIGKNLFSGLGSVQRYQ